MIYQNELILRRLNSGVVSLILGIRVEKLSVFIKLLGKPKGKKTLVRTRNRWKDVMKMYSGKTVYEGLD